jgi:hypothetical protein
MGHAKISPIRRPPASEFRFPNSGESETRVAKPACQRLALAGRHCGQAPGILHHITIRGIERRRIFRDSNDQDDLLA